jgi:hypothetical protein
MFAPGAAAEAPAATGRIRFMPSKSLTVIPRAWHGMKRARRTFNRASRVCNGRVAALAAEVFVDNRTGMSRRSAVRAWLALALASVSAFLSMWILVPAPSRALLPLGVGAPEVSAWLALLGLVALVLALRDVRRRWSARFASLLPPRRGDLGAALLAFPRDHHGRRSCAPMALGGKYRRRFLMRRASDCGPRHSCRSTFSRHARADVRLAPLVIFRLHRRGDTLTMDVYRPVSDGPYPVLVQVYGGAWRRVIPVTSRRLPSAWPISDTGDGDRLSPRASIAFRRSWTTCDTHWHGSVRTRISGAPTPRVSLSRAFGRRSVLAAYAPDAPHIRGVVDYYGPVDLIEGYRNRRRLIRWTCERLKKRSSEARRFPARPIPAASPISW